MPEIEEMPYTTTRIDRRNLVKLAGWGMTGLRPPGRGNMRTPDSLPVPLATEPLVAAQAGIAEPGATQREQA